MIPIIATPKKQRCETMKKFNGWSCLEGGKERQTGNTKRKVGCMTVY